MYDGSIVILEDVVVFYVVGGCNIVSGFLVGDGWVNLFKDSFVKGFILIDQEKVDLIVFLKILIDIDFVINE